MRLMTRIISFARFIIKLNRSTGKKTWDEGKAPRKSESHDFLLLVNDNVRFSFTISHEDLASALAIARLYAK